MICNCLHSDNKEIATRFCFESQCLEFSCKKCERENHLEDDH